MFLHCDTNVIQFLSKDNQECEAASSDIFTEPSCLVQHCKFTWVRFEPTTFRYRADSVMPDLFGQQSDDLAETWSKGSSNDNVNKLSPRRLRLATLNHGYHQLYSLYFFYSRPHSVQL